MWRHLNTVITFCFSDTFMAHNLCSGFAIQKHLHVNRNYRPNGTATSLSPKCYSANVPLDFCTTADFEMKYFLMKALLAFWVIPNWFSRFCSQNGYLNSKLMLRWDGHFKSTKAKSTLFCLSTDDITSWQSNINCDSQDKRFLKLCWFWDSRSKSSKYVTIEETKIRSIILQQIHLSEIGR